MPIHKSLAHLYGHEWKTKTRPRILERDGNRCKFCGKPNHTMIDQATRPGVAMWYLLPVVDPITHESTLHLINNKGEVLSTDAERLPLAKFAPVRVVLTIAHLDHDPTNNADDNLAALCQWCHLHHDTQQHKETRSKRKDAARPVLALLEGGSISDEEATKPRIQESIH